MALKWLSGNYDTSINYSVDVTIETASQIVDWSAVPNCSPYIMGIGMVEVYLNGEILQRDTWKELTPTSVEYLNSDTPLQAGDVVSIRYKHGSVSLGNIRIVNSYAELLNVQNAVFNEVAIEVTNKKFYRYGEHGWEDFVIPFTTQNVGVMLQHEVQNVVYTTQRQYDLQDIAYTPGMGTLMVFVNGEFVDPSKYVEVDANTILFNSDLPEYSSEIEFISLNTDTWEDSFSHTVEYGYNTEGNANKETVKINTTVVRVIDYLYDSAGNVKTETITKGAKTIIKDYQYDSSGNIQKVTVSVY